MPGFGRTSPLSDGFVAAFSDAYLALDSGSGDWKTATSRIFLAEKVPTPASGRFDANGRNVPSHGSYVQQADTLCAKAYEHFDGPEPTTLAAAITDLEKEKRVFTTLLADLTRTRTSPADKLRVDSTIVRELTAARALTPGIDALLRAYRSQDRPAARRALRQIQEATPILRDLSKAMSAYGATLCGDAFAAPSNNNAGPDVTA